MAGLVLGGPGPGPGPVLLGWQAVLWLATQPSAWKVVSSVRCCQPPINALSLEMSPYGMPSIDIPSLLLAAFTCSAMA